MRGLSSNSSFRITCLSCSSGRGSSWVGSMYFSQSKALGRSNSSSYLASWLPPPPPGVDISSPATKRSSEGTLPFLMRRPIPDDTNGKPNKPTMDDLIQVLENVRLGYLLSRFSSLESRHEWSSVLSLGEQQRLAFARLLLSKPKLVLLDESTSALDEDNEAHLYRLIEAAGITFISIGHRRTLYEHHIRVLHISTADPGSNICNWRIESIDRDASYSWSNR